MMRILKSYDVDDIYNLTNEMLNNSPSSFPDSVDENFLSKDFFMNYINGYPNSIIIGYFHNNKLVGMIGVYKFELKKTSHRGCIWNVYLKQEFRGRGIASKLLKECIKYADKIGIETLVLNVSQSSKDAIKLYKKFGFKVFGIEKDAIRYKGKSYTEYKMELKVKDVL